jgi:hypothetical protein
MPFKPVVQRNQVDVFRLLDNDLSVPVLSFDPVFYANYRDMHDEGRNLVSMSSSCEKKKNLDFLLQIFENS